MFSIQNVTKWHHSISVVPKQFDLNLITGWKDMLKPIAVKEVHFQTMSAR